MNQEVSKSMVVSNCSSRFQGQKNVGEPSPLLFQQPSNLSELRQALAASQQQLESVQQHLETLEQSNERFRMKLIRLAKKCNQARHFAYHDELTKLPNRRLLLDRLKQEMVQSVRQHNKVALLFIDLDRFKNINDRFGHLAGDQLLQQVAGRLTSCVRYGDTVCRYGGDEFVVLLTGIDAQESAAVLAGKIRVRLSSSYDLDSHAVEMTASIGVAVYRADSQNCNDFIKQADIAMYLAKVAKQPIKQPNTNGHAEFAFS